MKTDINDIEIRPNEFINWVEFDAKKANPIGIDYLIEPLENFLKDLETYCVAECCGILAFDWKEENVKQAYLYHDSNEIKKCLEHVINEIEAKHNEVVVSARINQLLARSVMIKLLYHLKNCA